MNKKLKTFRHYFVLYWWIPLGVVYMALGQDVINRMWYDDLWCLYGNIILIAGFFMFVGCVGIHILIFVVNGIDKYIRDTVRDEMGKGETNK